jgi:flagellin-like hook-associated protein FlgL
MISINVNPAASGAGLNLGKANEALQKSLARLSSGRRIVTSSDDAGGLAVSMKMSAALKRTEATAINLRNMVSYLDTQDGAFKVADKVLSRMSELSALARDVSKNEGDVENYNKEFVNLKAQIASLSTEKFNGVPLFSTGTSFAVPTSEDGTQTASVTKAALASDPMTEMMINGFQSIEKDGQVYAFPKTPGLSNSNTSLTAYKLPGGIGSPVTLNLTITSVSTSRIATYTSTTGSATLAPVGGYTFQGPNPSTLAATTSIVTYNTSFAVTVTDGSTTSSIGSYSGDSYDPVSGATISSTTLSLSTGSSPSYTAALGTSSTYSTGIETDLDVGNSKYYAYLSQEALQQVADMRAQNGAEMSRINFAQDLLDINANNLEAANSRIMDVDVASESSQLARFQILQQAGTAMLAQANTSQQSLVKLLQG